MAPTFEQMAQLSLAHQRQIDAEMANQRRARVLADIQAKLDDGLQFRDLDLSDATTLDCEGYKVGFDGRLRPIEFRPSRSLAEVAHLTNYPPKPQRFTTYVAERLGLH